MFRSILPTLLSFLILLSIASAQFQFFDQFFGQQGGQQQGHHHQQKENVPSDSNWYQQTWEGATCSNFLCPGTLACVHFPHHCPCPFPNVEDKVELADGSMICVSKGGYKANEASRKVELARKGLL